VEYEVAGPKCTDRSSLYLLGEDRVLLVTDDKGRSCWLQLETTTPHALTARDKEYQTQRNNWDEPKACIRNAKVCCSSFGEKNWLAAAFENLS